MNPLRSILLTAVTTALVLPAAASAATVSRQGDQIRYDSASGERNGVIVSASNTDDEIGFTENSPADLQAGPGCTLHPTENSIEFVTCPKSGVTSITVNLGDRDDHAALLEGPAPQPASFLVNGGPAATRSPRPAR